MSIPKITIGLIIFCAILCNINSSSVSAQVFTPPPKPAPKPPVRPVAKPVPKPPITPPKPARSQQPNRTTPQQSSPQQDANTIIIPLADTGMIDTFNRSSLPKNSWGGEQEIIVGGWGDTYEAFVWFDIGILPELQAGDIVQLQLYNMSRGGNQKPTDFRVFQANSLVTNTISYSQAFDVDAASEKTIVSPVYGRWVSIDITEYVQSWNTVKQNKGLAMVPLSTNNNFNFFVSSESLKHPSLRPRIRIEKLAP